VLFCRASGERRIRHGITGQKFLREALKGPFKERKIMPIADSMLSDVAPYMLESGSDRWSYPDFAGESDLIRKYIWERRGIIQSELENLQ
jgi:spore coat protein H